MSIGAKWIIVLAGGDGTRLRQLTMDEGGLVVPKQYCSLRGGPSLLEQTLQRAERLVPYERIVVVVAAEHERWWRGQLARHPAANIVVQPRNRGTGPGLLLPLLAVLARDSEASVLVLPSDHYVADEARLVAAAAQALGAVASGATGLLLVGVAAETPAADLGWIVPASREPFAQVASFVEKPAAAEALRLFAMGAVWNTFILASRGHALLALIDRCAPGLAADLRSALLLGGDSLARLYDTLPAFDFSRQVLQAAPERLRLLRAPPCGWTDLGTPERVARCVADLPPVQGPPASGGQRRHLDLARQIAGGPMGGEPRPRAEPAVTRQTAGVLAGG